MLVEDEKEAAQGTIHEEQEGVPIGYQFSLSGHFVYNCRHFCTISTHDNLINTAAFWRDTLRKHHCNVVGTLRYVYIYNGTYVLCV